jgi:hypothetical protein
VEQQCFHLKTGHETPETPILPPEVNSSALPLKSRITFPVLTSNIFNKTLYKENNGSYISDKKLTEK